MIPNEGRSVLQIFLNGWKIMDLLFRDMLEKSQLDYHNLILLYILDNIFPDLNFENVWSNSINTESFEY